MLVYARACLASDEGNRVLQNPHIDRKIDWKASLPVENGSSGDEGPPCLDCAKESTDVGLARSGLFVVTVHVTKIMR